MSLNYVTKLDLDSMITSLLSKELKRKSLKKPTSSLGEQTLVSEGSIVNQGRQIIFIQAMETSNERTTAGVSIVTRLFIVKDIVTSLKSNRETRIITKMMREKKMQM